MIYLVDYFVDGQLEGWGEIEAENEWDALEILTRDLLKEEPSRRKRMASVICGDEDGRFCCTGIDDKFLYVEGRDLLSEK